MGIPNITANDNNMTSGTVETKFPVTTFSFPETETSNSADIERFTELINKYGGFEMVLGFRDWEDHYIGGKGNTFWYYITDSKKIECYITTLKNGKWHDEFFSKKGRHETHLEITSGTTAVMIAERAFFGQERIKPDTGKGVPVTGSSCSCTRYNYSFGAVSYDISDEYGVTIRFSDCDKPEKGYMLRNINTDNNVKIPTFN